MRLAGRNILWFNHHYPAQTVSHSHFTLSPLQDMRSLPGRQWNWTTERAAFLSLFIRDYFISGISLRYSISIGWIHSSTHWKLLQDQLPYPQCVTDSVTCNLSLGGELKLLILGLESKVSISGPSLKCLTQDQFNVVHVLGSLGSRNSLGSLHKGKENNSRNICLNVSFQVSLLWYTFSKS